MIMCEERNWISVETCLSPSVHHMLCSLAISCEEVNVLNPSGTLNWKKVNDLLKIKDDRQVDSIYFEENISCLAPVFLHVQNTYEKMTKEQFHELCINLYWTKNEKIFLKCYNFLQQENSIVNNVLAVLYLTAAIERSLGNVFLLKEKQVPNLLRDLLKTSVLEKIFGNIQMKLLQILIGPPSSLNLRNLVWHGFVSPHEIQKCYGYFLLVLAISLGETLKENKINISDIPIRSNILFAQTSIWKNYFPDIIDNVITIKDIFSTSPIILSNRKIYWYSLLLKYQKKEYDDCIVLLLPQLECSLRVIYATVNNCQERILTAEVTSLYTTLEEILHDCVLDKPNMVLQILGENYKELLLDLFFYPEGPRIRDRVSHGEVNLSEIPFYLVHFILTVSIALCCKFLPSDNLLLKNEYVQNLHKWICKYMPVFHPISLLKQKFIQLLKSLFIPREYPQPEINEIEIENNKLILSFEEKNFCINELNISFSYWSSSEYMDLSKILNDVEETFPKIINQLKSNNEIVNLLRKITKHSLSTIEQLSENLNNKYMQWNMRLLRSRQRSNYIQLLKSVPVIRKGITFISFVILSNFLQLGNISCNIRLLKYALQYVENLEIYTNLERNQWIESCKWTTDFISKFMYQWNK